MKIIFLNAWEGTNGEVLWNFIGKQKETTEVFCFMEAGKNFRLKCEKILPNYACVSAVKMMANEDGFFQSTYVKKGNEILKSEVILKDNLDTGLGLYTQIERKEGIINVVNVHGVVLPVNKLDCPKRIEQSRELIGFLAGISGPKIIGGDFNLEPETESVKMFEKHGYRNLIKEFNVDTTRNHLSWDRYPNKQLFADYLFVSPEVKIRSFTVPKNEISDHLPLVLETED
jgi:hypothetical protein